MSRVSALELIAEKDVEPNDGVSAFGILNYEPAKAPQSFGIDFDQSKNDVRMAIKKLPAPQRKKAMRQWADKFVSKERAANKGSTLQYADDVWRNVTRGTLVGSFLDESQAATAAPISAVKSALGLDNSGAYDEALAYQRAIYRAIDKESTKIGSLPIIGDVTLGGAQKLAGGILGGGALLKAGARGFNVLSGASAPAQAGNLALNSGLAGAAYGIGAGEGAGDRAWQGLIGGGVGVVAPAAMGLAGRAVTGTATGVRDAVRHGAERLTGRSPVTPLSGYSRGAVNRAQRALVDDGMDSARGYSARSRQLGPEGMLLDMGDNLRGQAGAIANAPGRGQSVVKGALNARDRLSNSRLTGAINRNIGPEGGTISMNGGPSQRYTTFEGAMEAGKAVSDAMANPLYREFHRTRIEYTPRLRELVARAEALDRNIVDNARRLMVADGMPAEVRNNNSALLDYVRRSVDEVAEAAAARPEGGNVARIAGNVSRDLNDEIDNILQRQGSTIYRQARGTAQNGIEFAQGGREGLTMLGDKSLSAERVRRAMSAASPAEAGGRRIGVREDLRKRMMNAESAFGTATERGATKGRMILSSGEARGKLNAIVGPDAARNLTRTADAEAVFSDSSRSIMGNSATAGRLAAQKEFPLAVSPVDHLNEVGKKTLYGATAEAGLRAFNFMLRGALDDRRLAIATDAAQMLAARGVSRDAIAQALIARASRSGVSQSQREALGAIVGNITHRALPAITPDAPSRGPND